MLDGCLFTKYWRACEQYNRRLAGPSGGPMVAAVCICNSPVRSPPSPPVCVSMYPLLCPVKSPPSPPVCVSMYPLLGLLGSLGVDMFRTQGEPASSNGHCLIPLTSRGEGGPGAPAPTLPKFTYTVAPPLDTPLTRPPVNHFHLICISWSEGPAVPPTTRCYFLILSFHCTFTCLRRLFLTVPFYTLPSKFFYRMLDKTLKVCAT